MLVNLMSGRNSPEPRSKTMFREGFKVLKRVADLNNRMPKQWTLKYNSGDKKTIQQ